MKAVFAGHFHSDQEKSYGVPTGLRRIQADPCFVVAPPIASKFQKPTRRVQGYLSGRVDAQGEIVVQLRYRPGSAVSGTGHFNVSAACR